MNKEQLGKVLSLSCVENYFLGYFQERLDVRLLYAESFVPFQEVINAFWQGGASYENYPLVRVQETSEKLGLTAHQFDKTFRYRKGGLNLIRVNRTFFKGAKRMPWREDHFIAVEKAVEGYSYLNNYPLSEGKLSDQKVAQIYDGACLVFQKICEFDEQKYGSFCSKQYARIINQSVDEVRLNEEKITQLRDALLVLKVTRKRVNAWLRSEAEKKNFAEDLSFSLQAEKLNRGYESILTALQLQIVRKRLDVIILNDKLARLCESERLWSKEIQQRRQ